MANDVFANGREISCKAGDGKSICAFPDVCMTPPENPATPPGVPIPYPNTGMAKDTASGSKTVKITNKEVMLKNKSYFKKSTGDEAGSAAKKGVATSTNRGKVYFTSWSMNVKLESQNVVRALDLTTHNHMSQPPNTPPFPHQDGMAPPSAPPSQARCDHEWDCEPVSVGSDSLEEKKSKLSEGKKAGDLFELRAVQHNENEIKSGADVGAEFVCKKCPATKEIDHLTRDENGHITGIVQCKSDQSKAAGGDSEKGVKIKPKQLKEDRKALAAINERQKESGVEAKLEYKLEEGESAEQAKTFLMKKNPPIVTMVK